MNHQTQFEENHRAQSVGVERLTDDEAQAVMALWTEKQKARDNINALPTSADVAETLGTTVEQVEHLLQEVRRRGPRTPRRMGRKRIPASSGRVRHVVTLTLALYLLSPIPLGFVVNHFSDGNFARFEPLYAPLSWLHDNTALRGPLGLYGRLIDNL